ncbi:helix-turn-helix domain-containing protein [Klebsiella pneumoniae]|nr:helix-turn-helix domain-containing protein [Klebsiella pneumoniae]
MVCSLETGASLLWLATGIGSMYENTQLQPEPSKPTSEALKENH